MGRIVKMEKEEFSRSFLMSHISRVQNLLAVSPITPAEIKSEKIGDPHRAAHTATAPVEWPSEEPWGSLPALTVLPLVSPQPESKLVPYESDENYTETTLGSDDVHLEFASAKDSTSGLDLIPTASTSPHRSTSVPLIPTSIKDSASLYLPEPISSPDCNPGSLGLDLDIRPGSETSVPLIPTSTENRASLYLPEPISLLDCNSGSLDLDLNISPRSEASSNEKPSGWTKGRVAKLIKSVTKSTTESLPSSLDFCFSGPGNRIAIWCKEVADNVILINPQSYTGQRYALTMPTLPTHKRFSKKIRHLSSSGSIIVAIVHIENVGLAYSFLSALANIVVSMVIPIHWKHTPAHPPT